MSPVEDLKVDSRVFSDLELINELRKPGLVVVDMFAKFAGPCYSIQNIFKRIKPDYGDSVHFIQAQTDGIDAFRDWRNKSCPTYSFWINGMLVKTILGSNGPLIERTIREQVEMNKSNIERQPIQPEINIPNRITSDGAIGTKGLTTSVNDVPKIPENAELTLTIIKPDAMIPHVIEEIKTILRQHRFEIVKEKKVWLTRAQAAEFYKEHEGKAFFESLLDYLTSAPVFAMILSRENAVSTLRELIGPANSKRAQEVAPKSIRAQYGKDGTRNAIYGSDSKESAKREMHLIFSPSVAELPMENSTMVTTVQKTIAVITPDAFSAGYAENIISKIVGRGYEVLKRSEIVLSSERAAEFWSHLKDQPEVSSIVANWSSGPLIALLLSGENVANGWKEMAGPEDVAKAKAELPNCLRALFAVDNIRKAVYYSHSADRWRFDSNFFFPNPNSSVPAKRIERTLGIIKPDAVAAGKVHEIESAIKERGFAIVMSKQLQMTKELAELFYKDHATKPFFKDVVIWMSSEPIYAMILEKEDAIVDWRETMGPTNPEKAREIAPNSLRARYGQEGIQNALHGSDSPLNANREIDLIFGEELKAQAASATIVPAKLDRPKSSLTLASPGSTLNLHTPESSSDGANNVPTKSRPSSATKLNRSTAKLANSQQQLTKAKSNAGLAKSKPSLTNPDSEPQPKGDTLDTSSASNITPKLGGAESQNKLTKVGSQSKISKNQSQNKLPSTGSQSELVKTNSQSKVSGAETEKRVKSVSQLKSSRPPSSSSQRSGGKSSSANSLAGGAKKSSS